MLLLTIVVGTRNQAMVIKGIKVINNVSKHVRERQ